MFRFSSKKTWLTSGAAAAVAPAQIRSAWAISQSLGRALLLPELKAGLDRWWAPHTGIIPGSQLELPFTAPFDHLVDLEGCASH